MQNKRICEWREVRIQTHVCFPFSVYIRRRRQKATWNDATFSSHKNRTATTSTII